MPDYLKALIAILLVAGPVLLAARAPACASAIPEEDYRRRRNLWLTVTLLAFLAHDFWLFAATTGALFLVAGRRDPNPVAIFLFLVFAVPALSSEISGLGLARQFFALSYPRLLALTVLLPAALALYLAPREESPASKWPDRFLAGYIALLLGLQLTADTFTNTLRYGLYYFMDIALPYYVASRSLKSLEHFRDTLMSFLVAAMVLAAIGIFEFAKGWLLYANLDSFLGLYWGYGNYLQRGESLRALASTGQPIALGFVMAVACCLYPALRPSVPGQGVWRLGLCLLLAGLLAPISRGPWLGAAVGFTVFLAIGPSSLAGLAKLAFGGLAAGALVLLSPLRDTILDYLPFIGTVDRETIAYRQQLIDYSLDIVRQNPLFGSFDYMRYLEDLRQGQGIIDIVNTYLGVALSCGLAGLSLFVSFFLAIGAGLYRHLGARSGPEDESALLGRALFATLAGILVTILTVSSITVIPIVYWSVAGIGLAYLRLAERRALPAGSPAPAPQPWIAGSKA
jgi:hypothetical protein